MRFKLKTGLLALGAGVVALGTGTCLFRLLGDVVADQIWLGLIR